MEAKWKIPLVKPHLPNLDDIESQIRSMLESGRLTNFGNFSKLLESRICEYLGVKYAICVSNATAGLIILLNSLPKGSEVIVPSFTFLPTVQAVLWNSLIPVFVDIDSSYTISPSEVVSLLSDRTSAILGVHAFGNPCNINELENISRQRGIKLFFDSAHAFGTKYSTKHVGGFGDAEVFSFSVTKLLPCGEGGVITSNSKEICKLLLDRRNYGFTSGSNDSENLGLNGKMTEFSAILGLWGLDYDEDGIRRIDKHISKRNEIAKKYIDRLGNLSGLNLQKIRTEDTSTYKDFTIAIDSSVFGTNRYKVKEELRKRGVETTSYFSPAIHQMTYFKQKSEIKKTNLQHTNLVESRILSLPMYFDLSDEDLEYVISAIEDLSR
jgi:dTDP-4-amino-4,6-dideoxygalactose transaminase